MHRTSRVDCDSSQEHISGYADRQKKKKLQYKRTDPDPKRFWTRAKQRINYISNSISITRQMAEFVGAIGTVAAVAQMAEYAAKASLEFYDFLKTIKNAPREILDITRDTNTFHKLVCNLQGSLSSPTVQDIVSQDADISHALEALEEPMANCCGVFKSLTEKMRPHLKEDASVSPETEKTSTNSESSSKSNWKISRADMKWYFKRREVYSLVSQLERTKVTFADAMGSATLYDPALFLSLPCALSSILSSVDETYVQEKNNR